MGVLFRYSHERRRSLITNKTLYIHNSPANIPLPVAQSVRVRNTTKGEYFLTFSYPKLQTDTRYSRLATDVIVQLPDLGTEYVSNQMFTITSVKESRSSGKTYKNVEACHVGLTLGRYFYDGYIDFSAAADIADMLALLADDTPFTFNVIGTFEPQDIFEWGEKSKLALLHELCELYGAEIAYDNYTITVAARTGGNYGATLRYRRNIKNIQRTVHSPERITRLYGYGKNGLTIEGYDGHITKYIDSTYYDTDNPFEASVTFVEIDSQAKLLTEMQKHLAKYELPAVSYDVTYMPRYDNIRGVGDTVTVDDRDLGYKFDARIVAYDYNPLDDVRESKITLANFRELTAVDYIVKATVGSQRAIKYTSKNAVLKGVKYDDSITLVDGMGMAVSDDLDRIRVRLGQVEAGEYGLTLYNKAGAKTLWLDATTGDAMFSGNIVASNFRTNPDGFPFVELSSDNNVFKAAKSATAYIEIEANPASYAAPIIKNVDGSSVHYSGLMGGSYFSLVSGGNYDINAQDGTLRLSGSAAQVTTSTSFTVQSDMTLPSGKNFWLSSTSQIIFGGQTLSSIISSLSGRISALEEAVYS